ncbi:hypothetical protein BN946_scf184470.g37 [Trametes cinnabarina]|uniref:Uncharacterized protein n=1 Tax=Pycnoporus cinnabarinus TaxID=5643 RepID=A0A060SVR1_PYCCI|nr:hypothetical protein BN946_scf184470.g37 [Trametes cinnabarina]
MMDRLFAPQSAEAQAHSLLTENWFSWDQDHPSLDETLTAGCATYEAFQRYLNGQDLYLVPRTGNELESVLRYATDAIHNTISKSRSQLERGGYARICQLVEKSITQVLGENDNAAFLLSLHRPRHEKARSPDLASSPRFIKIK